MRKEELGFAIDTIIISLENYTINKLRGSGELDGKFMAKLIKENKEVVSSYLDRSDNIIHEVAYFIDFLKQVARKFIKEGNSALFFIYIIAWFNLKDYAKENMIRNKCIYMNHKLDIIRKEYTKIPKTFMAQCVEETYHYFNTLTQMGVSPNYGFKIFDNYHIAFILNTVMEISIENEEKRWKVIEEKVEQSMISK